jgi:uncharacterized membrane protein
MTFFSEVQQDIQKLIQLKNNLSAGVENLSRKLNRQEEFLQKELNSTVPKKPEPLTTSSPNPVLLKPTPQLGMSNPSTKPVSPRSARPPIVEDATNFEVKLGQKWLLILGIVTMVFGIGYFLKYSFEQGWVGPAGREAMTYFWGLILLLAGDRFRKKELEVFGLYLVGGGIAVLYFSTFAGFQIYHLLNQTLSFSIMVLITALAATLAVVYDTKWLAVLGLIGGFLTPVLLATHQDNQIALMSYMTILNLGLLGIAFYKQWNILNILGFFATYSLFSAWYSNHEDASKFWLTLYFLNEFYLLYTFIPLSYLLFVKRPQVNEKPESEKLDPTLLILGLNSLIAFGFNFNMIKERFSIEYVGIVTLIYAALFLSISSYLKKDEKSREIPFVLFLGKAALFLVITIPIIFSMHWITLFWSIQSGILIWIGLKLNKTLIKSSGYVLFGMTIVKFIFHDYPEVFHLNLVGMSFESSYTYMMIQRFLTTLVLLGSLFTGSRVLKYYFQKHPILKGNEILDENKILDGTFGFLLFLVLNVEVLTFFHDYLFSARFAAVSVLWTLFAVALMALGFRYNHLVLRKTSFALFFITAFKVFLIDISSFSTPYRIISFIILGIVLVMTSYLYYRFKGKIIPAEPVKDPVRGKT